VSVPFLTLLSHSRSLMLSNISPATETNHCNVVWNYARCIQQGVFLPEFWQICHTLSPLLVPGATLNWPCPIIVVWPCEEAVCLHNVFFIMDSEISWGPFTQSLPIWRLTSREHISVSQELYQLLTNFMELRPSWEAASCAATQEFPSILRILKVQYHVHKSSPPVPILSQINPVHMTPFYISLRTILILYTHLHHGLPSGLFLSGYR
jgi:hypothetical protein